MRYIAILLRKPSKLPRRLFRSDLDGLRGCQYRVRRAALVRKRANSDHHRGAPTEVCSLNISRPAGNRAGRHCAFPACDAACSRRAASSPPALWPLIIVAAPGRIVEAPATPAEADVDIGRARAVGDA